MERESFEDDEVANLLNDGFISIKVDREERPDVDHVYMTACMALTGSGGWPLTVFLDHDRRPFFAGTYFPKEDLRGRTGLMSLLMRVSALWQDDRASLAVAAESMMAAISSQPEARDGDAEGLARRAEAALLSSFDSVWGGFGKAPKFPAPHNLIFLLRRGRREAVGKTLDAMAAGGIRDHIGGGFCRYATDRRWLIPHFEKMLYDNALFLMVYAEASRALESAAFAAVADEVVAYAQREMSSPEGGFYTAQDADSEGEEGKFYLWTPGEVETVLREDARRFCSLYGITERGNFEGRSIPNRIGSVLSDEEEAFLSPLRPKLLDARERRIPPLRDEKILLTGNALMIAALASGGLAMERPGWIERAEDAARFLWEHMRDEQGRWNAAYQQGVSSQPATLDGYAYLVWAMIELHQATLKDSWLARALDAHEAMMALFHDASGDLFYNGSDIRDLPVRITNHQDGAVPSGASCAIMNTLRLAHLLGRPEWSDTADAMIARVSLEASHAPAGYAWLAAALAYRDSGGCHISVTQGTGSDALIAAAREGYHPHRTLSLAEGSDLAAATVCVGDRCLPSVRDAGKLREILRAHG